MADAIMASARTPAATVNRRPARLDRAAGWPTLPCRVMDGLVRQAGRDMREVSVADGSCGSEGRIVRRIRAGAGTV
ncbi:hypothetical protein GCM10019059_13320 [Camelimonas fluminis]|nr:hypothetical protein GCM10019059_13320 [Camelimonas fluminis]